MHKKIVFFIPTMGQGGAEKVFLNLANKFVQDHEVTLIVQKGEGPLMKLLDESILIKEIGINSKFLFFLKYIQNIVRINPDVVISTHNIPNFLNSLGKLMFGFKYFGVVRQPSPLQINNYNRFIRWSIGLGFRYSNSIIANSEFTKNSILSGIPEISSEKIVTIYNPVFRDHFYELAEKEIDFFLEKPFILCVGRLEECKNFKWAIKAYKLSESKEQFDLIILGDGNERENLEILIDQLNLKKKVHLLGNVENPFPFYQKAQIFILPSHWEGFGNVLVEALAFGIPIIASKTAGAPSEILNNGEYGIMVPHNDCQEMANKIDLLLSSSGFDKQKLVNRAKEFSIEKIALQYAQALNLPNYY